LAGARLRVYERRMRNLSCSMIALVAVVLAACGASSKQVATAKEARYQGDRSQMFAVIKQTVLSKYKIQKADEASLGLQTEGRWYNPDGQPVSGTLEDVGNVPDRGLNISLVVELLPEGDHSRVSVKPVILRYLKGHSQPEAVDVEKDPTIPDWARDKVTDLQVDLHKALQQYEMKGAAGAGAAGAAGPGVGSAGSPMPPPTTAPAPDPIGPTSTPPPPAP
jgi:hypothetical protein